MDKLAETFPGIGETFREQMVGSLFKAVTDMCEGILMVDQDARITWIDDKYKALLGVTDAVIGKVVEEVIPKSLMRRVVETGKPILLDLMEFGDRSFVVVRFPLKRPDGGVQGAVGFVLFDRFQYLQPIMSKVAGLRDELASAQRQLAGERRAKYTFTQFLGTSDVVREVKRTARRAAQFDTTVLLLGETGTGKELLAHAIHAASERADKPFVAVNLAAIPETLMEAEFFGVAPGAYTGADRRGRDGKFVLAAGGTLFLDEIGDMPMALQAKLLRALQEREIEPLGSNKVIKIDVRVIAATSRDMAALLRDKAFRPDLYYRLNVLPITLPPLRNRAEDIQDIGEALLERIAQKTFAPQRELAPSAIQAFAAYQWPGNVRELANVLERMTALSDSPVLTAEDVAMVLPGAEAAGGGETDRPDAAGRPAPRAGGEGVGSLQDVVADAERAAIAEALRRAKGVKSEAARLLGISRANLYDKLSGYGMLTRS